MATWIGADQNDFHGATAAASGWFERARRLLDPLAPGAEHGWLAFHEGYLRHRAGEGEAARALATEAADLGRRFGVPDLEMLGLALEGASLVAAARVSEGMRRLDEAAAIALEERAEIPISGAWVCCFLVSACLEVYDFERAFAWSDRVAAFAAALRQPLDARVLPRRVRRRAPLARPLERGRGAAGGRDRRLRPLAPRVGARPAHRAGRAAPPAGPHDRGARAARPRRCDHAPLPRPDRARPRGHARRRRARRSPATADRSRAPPRPRRSTRRVRARTPFRAGGDRAARAGRARRDRAAEGDRRSRRGRRPRRPGTARRRGRRLRGRAL